MLPRGCCSCCKDDNEVAPHERLPDDDGYSFGCADFCGSSSRMSEGRQSQIVLLDDRRLDLLIKPKLYAGELLDMVASHFSLKEKEYFGLAYLDDTGHYSWLQLDRRVLEHEFPKRSAQSTLLLYFRIKYFVESITHLRDRATVEAFYLQTQSLVYNGVLEISTDKVFQLAALVLQATHGDFTSDEIAKEQLKKLPVLPTSALVDHPSLLACEERILEQYRYAQGQSRGTAIVNYMRVAESLPTYGVHYYEVKDKANIPWWLGISYKGICQYDYSDRKVPRKLFLWKQLENLYFRDRKFSIEVSDSKRVTASRKTFSSGSICVYVWFASSPSLTKCIWLMACSQHQFYLDRRHNKNAFSPSRNLSEIADELSHNSYSTETSSLGRSVSSLSLPALKLDSDSCDEVLDSGEMFVALKARREALEEVLRRKSEELKSICLREGELTGALPPEMPLCPGEQIPIVQRKSGIDVQDKWLLRKKTKDEEECASLELEYAIQNKIVSAALKLLNDTSQKKNLRRQRKLTHQKAVAKLKEIEHKLSIFKKEQMPKSLIFYSNTENNVSAKLKELSITFTPTENEKEASKNSLSRMKTSKSSPIPLPSHLSSSVPSSPARTHKQQRGSLAEQQDIVFPPAGYTPSTIYQTRTSYRSQQYPTFSMRSPTSCSSASSGDGVTGFGDKDSAVIALTAPYRNKFESTLDLDGSNLYSVPTQRTSQAFDTQDDILATLPISPQDLGLVSRHNSLDRNRRHSFQKYKQYLETFSDCSRPNSTQPPYDQNRSSVPSPSQLASFPDYGFRHPHHYHHHRHQEVARAQQSSLKNFQKNLAMYAADAMFVSSGGNDDLHKSRYPTPVSPEPVKRWTEFSATDSNSRTIIGPCSQPSVPTRVQSSVSMDALKSHVVSSYPGPSTDSSSANAKNRTILSPSNLPNEKSWPPKVQTSTSMGSIKSHVRPVLQNVNVVSYGHFQPYWEETKPYETADFYKYSTKHRKQHQVASQNLQAKLLAWKASQSTGQYLSGAPPPMSPVMERSKAGSSASSSSSHQESVEREDNGRHSSAKLKSDGNYDKQTNANPGNFCDNWYGTTEKGKKTTLV